MEPRILFLTVSLAVLATTPRAAMLALYTAPGDTLGIEDAPEVARAAREGGSIPARYVLRSSDSAVLTEAFSVPEGTSAYFWSDETYRYAGFAMRGTRVRFDGGPPSAADGEALAKEAQAPEIAWTTRLGKVSLSARTLRLGYSLAAGGRVSVEVLGLDGRILGEWSWVDGSAGARERTLVLRRVPEGPAWVRWTQGDAGEIRALPVSAKR